MADIASPDLHGAGLTQVPLEPVRYDGQLDHPSEVAGIIHDMMPSGVSVLDVGCGTGSVTLIANRGRENKVLAVEPDIERASLARSRGINVENQELNQAFIEKNGQFDIVMSSDVLEHVADPAKFIKLFKNALKSSGLLIISVPNIAHWSVRLNLLRGRFDYESVGIMDATHLRWFTYATLKDLLERCDFDIVECKQSAGSDLPIYGRNRITRRIPTKYRTGAVRFLAKKWPLIFGVQHVVKARIAQRSTVISQVAEPHPGLNAQDFDRTP